EPGREAGAAASALARGLHLVDQVVAALLEDRLGAVPGAALARAVEAPVALAVEILENAVLVVEHRSRLRGLERGRAPDRRRDLPVDLRPRFRRPAGSDAVEHLLEGLGGEILVGILADQHHRRVHAGAEALDLLPGEVAVGRDMERIVVDAPPADPE